MRKIFLILTTIFVFAGLPFCEASKATNATYINDNYFVTAESILKDDFFPKFENVMKTYPENAKDIAGADLAIYTKPKLQELKEKLQNDSRAKDSYIATLTDTYISCVINFLDVTARVKDKPSLDKNTWLADWKNSAAKVKEANDKFKQAYSSTQSIK
jgi:hypothetical protein